MGTGITNDGTGEVAQSTQYLPGNHEDLSLIPRNYAKKPGVVARVCNTNTREVETGGCLGPAAPSPSLCGKSTGQ